MFRYKGLKLKEGDAALPKTRKELFKTIVRDDFYLLAEISVILFLFSIPLAAGFILEVLMITHLPDLQGLFWVCFYSALIEIPLFGVRYIGRHAAFGVMKKRVQNEGGYIKELFFQNLKKGFVKGFLAGCLVGFIAFLWQVGSIFVLTNDSTWIKGLGLGATTLIFAIFYVAVEYFLSVDNFYELKFSGALKNGLSFTIMHFPMSLVYFVACVGVPFALTVISPWAIFAFAAVMAFWGDGFTVLVATLYSHTLFDRYINSVYYPDYINKGLAPREGEAEKENDNG